MRAARGRRRAPRGSSILALALAAVGPSLPSPLVRAVPTHPAARASGLRVLVEPTAGFGFLASAIEGAKHRVLMEMYELDDPRIEAALEATASAHVVVEVLLDEAYAGRSENAAAVRALRAGHVDVRWANAGTIFHEKAVVVDATAYVGTANLTAQDYATTRDFWVVDRQPADVAAIVAAFDSDWRGGPPRPAPTGADLVWSPGALPVVLSLISSARHTIVLETEELSSTAVVDALVAAARRHVLVELTMTYSSQWQWAFTDLLKAHAHVHVDYGESPVYIHAKALCVDCTGGAHATGVVLVGSQNLATASLVWNRELSVRTSDSSVVGPIAAQLHADYAAAASLAP